MEIIQSCLSCPVTEEGLFCDLGGKALAELNAIRQSSVYPKGAVLFVEGQPPSGLFILCSGKVKLSVSYPLGKSVIVHVAGPGEVLGLSAAISGDPCEVSAETLEPSQMNFLPRDTFLSFLEENGEVAVRIAQHASADLRRAYQQVARIALAPSARAKLAGCLLDWADGDTRKVLPGARFRLPLTRQEIGEFIGSSRETVSRILTEFDREGLIRANGSSITLKDPSRLRKILS